MEVDKISYKNIRKETMWRYNLYNSWLYVNMYEYIKKKKKKKKDSSKNSSNSVIKKLRTWNIFKSYIILKVWRKAQCSFD